MRGFYGVLRGMRWRTFSGYQSFSPSPPGTSSPMGTPRRLCTLFQEDPCPVKSHCLPCSALALAVVFAVPSLLAQSSPAATDRQRAALKKACSSGVLSPEECKAKLAAMEAPASQAAEGGHDSRPSQAGGFPEPKGFEGGLQQYHDPRGRFNLTIPPGWQVAGDADQLRITQGSTWAVFTTSTNGGQPMDVDQALARQMQPQYQRFAVLNQGAYQTANFHHPAAGITLSTVKDGKETVMLIVTQGAGSGHYLTMISSTPNPGGGPMNGQLNNIFETVRFGQE